MNATEEKLLKNTVQGKLGELIMSAGVTPKQAVEMIKASSLLLVWGEAVTQMAEKNIEPKESAEAPWMQRPIDWEAVALSMNDDELRTVYYTFKRIWKRRSLI